MAKEAEISSVGPSEIRPGETLVAFGAGFKRGDRVEIWDVASGMPECKIPKKNVKRASANELLITIPNKVSGGRKRLAIFRGEETYIGEALFTVVPAVSETVVREGSELVIRGKGFAPGSRVRIGDTELIPTKASASRLSVTLPRTLPVTEALAPIVSIPDEAPLAAAEPARAPGAPTELTTGFRVARDGFSFPNDVSYQMASWGTFVETFGQEQIKAASKFSTFLFLWAYYALYTAFFEGIGIFQASGLCSGMAAFCLERYCSGESAGDTPNFALQPTPEIRRALTVRMGKVLGREVLALAYEQCKRGLQNIPFALNQLRAGLRDDIRAESAQMLWFLPSGRLTERKFLERLGYAHAVVPYGLLEEQSADGTRWRIPIYDVNMPGVEDVWVEIEQREETWTWRHSRDERFHSGAGMTLAAMPLQLFLKPAELPFSGPFSLTKFIFDMLL